MIYYHVLLCMAIAWPATCLGLMTLYQFHWAKLGLNATYVVHMLLQGVLLGFAVVFVLYAWKGA